MKKRGEEVVFFPGILSMEVYTGLSSSSLIVIVVKQQQQVNIGSWK